MRLATYESASEGKLIRSFFAGRSGGLENTTTVLLGPDGKQRLSRSGRGPSWLISGEPRGRGAAPTSDGARRLADLLASKAKPYRAKPEPTALPVSLDFRRALNVAACDGRPLVVVVAESRTTRAQIEKRLAKLAWTDDFIGRLHYALVAERSELAKITGVPKGEGIVVIEPGRFGQDGRVVATAAASSTDRTLGELLRLGLTKTTVLDKSQRQHVMAGQRAGARWESEIPVTDPDAVRAGRGGRR